MPKTTEEDTTDLAAEETLPEAEVNLVDETEEIIPEDEEGKPIRKKVAALKARHRLEDYFAFKDIQDQLDYLDDETKRKTELLAKVAQVERIEHPEPVVKPAPKEAKKVIAAPKVVETKVVPPKVEAKPVILPVEKVKGKEPPKAKAKPKLKEAKETVKAKVKAKAKTKPKPKVAKPKKVAKAKTKKK